MKRNAFTKTLAWLLCAMLLVGCLPVAAFATNDWEGELDQYVEPAGKSDANPIYLETQYVWEDAENMEGLQVIWCMTDAEYEPTYFVIGGPGGQYTFSVVGEGDFSVTINGEKIAAVDGTASAVVGMSVMSPLAFAIDAAGTDYYIELIPYTEDPGAFEGSDGENAAELVIGANANTTILNNWNEGNYWYKWTAPQDGVLTLSFNSYVEGALYTDIQMQGPVYEYLSENADGTMEIEVTAGIEYLLNVVVVAADYTASEFSIQADFAEGHTHEWGEWEVVTAATNTTEGQKQRTCATCGETETAVIPVVLKLRWASLLLSSNITILFETSDYVANSYDDIYVVFNFRGEEITLHAPEELNDKNRLEFPFSGVASNWMAEEVSATIYGTYDGELVTGETTVYSVKKYCESRFAKSSDAKELKMLVDLMNYGGAAQEYTGYNLDNKVNKDLTDEQKAYGTSTIPAFEDLQKADYAVVDSAKAAFKSISLILDSAVVAQFKFVINEGSIEDYKIVVETERTSWTYDASECEYDASSGRYIFNFDGMFANEMRTPFYLTIYQGDVAVSNTVRYSIGSFVARNYGKEGKETQSAMILAMLRYGDSVAENFPPVA